MSGTHQGTEGNSSDPIHWVTVVNNASVLAARIVSQDKTQVGNVLGEQSFDKDTSPPHGVHTSGSPYVREPISQGAHKSESPFRPILLLGIDLPSVVDLFLEQVPKDLLCSYSQSWKSYGCGIKI